ncbi:MAG: hypothetical protein ACKO96_04860 [Flammeovirgaceae bacterium]
MNKSHAHKGLEIAQRTGIWGTFAKQINYYDDKIIIEYYDGSSIELVGNIHYHNNKPKREKWWIWKGWK